MRERHRYLKQLNGIIIILSKHCWKQVPISNLPNNDGVTPKMIAIEDDDTYVVDLMEQYGPQIKEPAEY